MFTCMWYLHRFFVCGIARKNMWGNTYPNPFSLKERSKQNGLNTYYTPFFKKIYTLYLLLTAHLRSKSIVVRSQREGSKKRKFGVIGL